MPGVRALLQPGPRFVPGPIGVAGRLVAEPRGFPFVSIPGRFGADEVGVEDVVHQQPGEALQVEVRQDDDAQLLLGDHGHHRPPGAAVRARPCGRGSPGRTSRGRCRRTGRHRCSPSAARRWGRRTAGRASRGRPPARGPGGLRTCPRPVAAGAIGPYRRRWSRCSAGRWRTRDDPRIAPPVAQRQPIGRNVRRWDRGRHVERPENPLGDESLPRPPRNARHHLAEDGVHVRCCRSTSCGSRRQAGCT